MALLRIQWACVVILLAATAVAVRGDVPQIDPKQGPLQAVLDRIHDHAASDAWKKGAFSDEVIEKWLDLLVGTVAKAAKYPELKLPVRLADVKSTQPQILPGDARGTLLTGVLVIAKDIDFKTARLVNSVVLADGTIEIEAANGCVIIARGPVIVRGLSSHSVIVSGVYIKVARFDGQPTNTANGSLLVSRSRAEIATAYGSFIAAPDGLVLERAVDARFINMPMPDMLRAVNIVPGGPAAAGNAAGQKLPVPDFPLERFPRHSMAARFELTGVVNGPGTLRTGGFSRIRSDSQITGAVFRFDGRRYVAELGQRIVNEAGDPVQALLGWQLTFATDNFAVFSADHADIVVELATKKRF
jgi:hypothetical protein